MLFAICLIVRIAFVVAACTLPTRLLPYMGALALIPTAGFAFIFVNGLRKTGVEVGGGRIWWNNLRPVHATLYAAFAVLAICKLRAAFVPLLLDVLVGLTAFVARYQLNYFP